MKIKSARKVLCFMLSALLIVTVFVGVPTTASVKGATTEAVKLDVSNVEYAGSGTKDNPYRITTPEQLQGMLNNLSAHYKLARNIDLSGVDFVPIGRLNEPFTGSFICELSKDGTPKYAIKNLDIYNNAGEKYGHKLGNSGSYVDYVQNGSKWEAALFGAARSAAFENIALLDVVVTNTVVGQNSINADFTVNPGMNEMNAAALIGHAYETTVKNCITTGIINAKSNICGGLIGYAKDSTISDCYSTVTVTSQGLWTVGGLIGECENIEVYRSFAMGDVTGVNDVGAFVGTISGDSLFEDCYAIGDIYGGGRNNAAFVGGIYNSSKFKNCFALGQAEAIIDNLADGYTTENSWVLSGAVHNTKNFTEGTIAQIKAAFSELENWDASGEYPMLSIVGIITDETKYDANSVSNDLNGDGRVSIKDLTVLKRQIAGIADITDEADLNYDGSVNATDLILMQKCILGVI